MSMWDQMAALMDGKVDDYLGDDISYKRGAAAAQDVKGFVLTVGENQAGYEDLDAPVGTRKRVKLNRLLAVLGGGEPARADRLTAPKLGAGTWQPISAEPDLETQGRYWIFDVQKVAA